MGSNLISSALVSHSVQQNADQHRDTFLHAKPFRHVVIENFFEPDQAERLLADFPSFDLKLARAENGMVGGKAVNSTIREISPVYREFYEAISGSAFLELVSRLSGIPNLILDPKMFGGGTHENLHGQELDPHIDFNYDEAVQLHRRLNLIVYLNKDWKTEWGGALEIHSNPRNPFENRVSSYDPLFNRCVIFETNEYSWHGFPKINLPLEERQRSRKSISIYLYTKDRPAEEIAPVHSTFYVQRFLPSHVTPGYTLKQEDVAELQRLLSRRDNWIATYQQRELETSQSRHSRVPLTGYVIHKSSKGLSWDGWASSHAEIEILPLVPVVGILLRGSLPEGASEARIRIAFGNSSAKEFKVNGGDFQCSVRLPSPTVNAYRVKIDCEIQGQAERSQTDSRDLAFLLLELRARHSWTRSLPRLLALKMLGRM